MAPRLSAGELSRRLSRRAEAVCRHYLRAGRKEGRYWLVGDVRGAPGRSLYVRLIGPESGKGAAGNWTDAATGEHGDLLDLIGLNRGLTSIREVMVEARAYLNLPRHDVPCPAEVRASTTPRGSAEAARRLFAMSQPIAGTLAETYLRRRNLEPAIVDVSAVRFHPRCYYRDSNEAPTRTFPALIAGVTDLAGRLTGVHRTWLDPASPGDKAPVSSPRRAMGDLLGAGVRFGKTQSDHTILVAGEGLETIMSLRMAMPGLPMIAGLSANHLAALLLPDRLVRLYIAVDADPAGRRGMERLSRRAREVGIEALSLVSRLGDFNEDLRRLGLRALARGLRDQLAQQDSARFLIAA
ncbi:MAG TPA: toprim domain-containing protein [Roseiarcus sp.]|nr:toprim domain-containing protein [Roseiarcus sp.]